jgi:hypothetical protein
MSGILHIFRTQPDLYQVNYTIGATSYARTCTAEQLEHLLVTPTGFAENLVNSVFQELAARNNVTVSDVSIPGREASALGFEPMPSDA